MLYTEITTKKINKLINLILAITTIFLLIRCNKSSPNDNPSPAPSPQTGAKTPVVAAAAIIQNFAFVPTIVYLKAGGSVTWTNLDSAPHSVTDSAGGFDSKILAVNQTYLHRFSNPGTYTYHCAVHPSTEIAKIIVTN
ncbi:plastocyanin/azurin family copper-binding protein [Mucilaginibacter arboris]|uniref:Blue (type 1) copper domain-containing protein n=1 Tax=Mucilaginibacter arboris TaxID=2682090 RepID=A0A7K1SZZ0_9SPHI|nr:plastocyanin/azurin family copper-binding protein [Mucilaginibacter arboris]MVN22884.1 hypothetical protein [Mucilaginibacter arboris]